MQLELRLKLCTHDRVPVFVPELLLSLFIGIVERGGLTVFLQTAVETVQLLVQLPEGLVGRHREGRLGVECRQFFVLSVVGCHALANRVFVPEETGIFVDFLAD